MSNGVVQRVTPLIKTSESLSLTPYLCPAGVPTIGWGATYYFDGTRVTLRDPAISEETAELLLQFMLVKRYIPNTARLCPGLSTNQLAALTDFTFNLGEGKLRASTLRRVVNAGGSDAEVAAELRKWVIGGGRKLRGLVLRREREIAMWKGELNDY